MEGLLIGSFGGFGHPDEQTEGFSEALTKQIRARTSMRVFRLFKFVIILVYKKYILKNISKCIY